MMNHISVVKKFKITLIFDLFLPHFLVRGQVFDFHSVVRWMIILCLINPSTSISTNEKLNSLDNPAITIALSIVLACAQNSIMLYFDP